jgi:hypothetical protein
MAAYQIATAMPSNIVDSKQKEIYIATKRKKTKIQHQKEIMRKLVVFSFFAYYYPYISHKIMDNTQHNEGDLLWVAESKRGFGAA